LKKDAKGPRELDHDLLRIRPADKGLFALKTAGKKIDVLGGELAKKAFLVKGFPPLHTNLAGCVRQATNIEGHR
jgi:hypothetical protein